MRTAKVLWSFAMVCAVLLLFGPLGGRTEWTHERGSRIRDSAGYDWLAPLSGIAAMAGLAAGVLARPRVVVPVLGATLAVVAFGATAFAAGQYWMAALEGKLQTYGEVLGPSQGYTVRPATGPPFFAVIATVATGFALVLAVSWLKPAEDEW